MLRRIGGIPSGNGVSIPQSRTRSCEKGESDCALTRVQALLTPWSLHAGTSGKYKGKSEAPQGSLWGFYCDDEAFGTLRRCTIRTRAWAFVPSHPCGLVWGGGPSGDSL